MRQVDVLAAQIGCQHARDAASCLLDHGERRAHLPGRAVTALESILLDERALQRMQLRLAGEPFHRRDFTPLILNGKGKARVDSYAVDQHGARSACALIATLLGARESQMLAQKIEKGGSWIERHLVGASVDGEVH